jgi:hypothetical protein
VELTNKGREEQSEPVSTPLQSHKAPSVREIKPVEFILPIEQCMLPKVDLVEMVWQQGLSDQAWRRQLEERQQSIQEKRRKVEQLAKTTDGRRCCIRLYSPLQISYY